MSQRALLLRAGVERFGIPIGLSLGVVDAVVTELPWAKQEMAGLLIHEGTIFPVFDPAPLLELHAPLITGAIVVLLEVAGEPVALLCDAVEGTAPVQAGALETETGVRVLDLEAVFGVAPANRRT